ncbi:hypothetical protein [Nitrosopumilus sp. S6]
MKTKTTITTLTAITIASMLLISGFNLPAAEAKTSSPVKTIKIAPVLAQEPYFHSQPRTIGYVYIFEACAGEEPIIAPEIVVRSDSEIRSVNLATDLSPNSCTISSTIIKAASSDSISGALVAKDVLTKMANESAKKVSDIKMKLNDKNIELLKIVKTPSGDTKSSKLAQLTGEIVDLRQQLKDARAEYYRVLFLMYG